MNATRDDKALVQLALAGELTAFDELARRHQAPLLRFLRRRLNDADVEDAAQDVLIRAYQRLGQFRAVSSFRSWLFSIAYREMIDRLRRPRLVGSASVDIPSHDSPAETLIAAEGKVRLWAMARSVLSEDQYTAVWLFYGDDMNSREIARVMDRSWVNVKVMLHRARAALASSLKSEGSMEKSAIRQLANAGEL